MAAPVPPRPPESIDVLEALRFPMRDPRWMGKVGLGALFTALGILLVGIPFVAGYQLRVVQRAARDEPEPLPAWEDLGGIFADGLRVIAFYLVHVLALLSLVLASGAAGAGLGVALAGLSGSREVGGSAVAGALAVAYTVGMLGSLVLSAWLPPAIARFAVADADFGVIADPRGTWGLVRRNVGNYLMVIVVAVLGQFVAQFGILLCCVGLLPAAFWAGCATAWAAGRLARIDALQRGVALPTR